MSGNRTVIVYPDADGVAEATGSRLLLAVADAVAVRGVAHVVLTGGTVGIELLRRAEASPLVRLVDWTSVHVWWADERFVASGHPDRNEGQAQEALLRHIPLPEENIHRAGSADQFTTVRDAAASYDGDIARGGEPTWDVALFGMGPDGHVASLFPGHGTYFENMQGNLEVRNAAAVVDSPKPPAERITMTLAAINRARNVWIVAAGAEKAQAVAAAMHSESTLPVAAVHGTERTLWLIDAAASTAI